MYLVSPAASSDSPAMQLVLSQLTNTPVVLIATPELTQAALEKLDVAEEYTHLLLANNTRLQVSAQGIATCCMFMFGYVHQHYLQTAVLCCAVLCHSGYAIATLRYLHNSKRQIHVSVA